MGEFVPAIVLTFVTFMLLVWMQFTPPSRGAVIAVFPSNKGMDDVWTAVANTEAQLVRGTRFSNTFVLYSDEKGFPTRLKEEGAMLVFAYSGVTWCGAKINNNLSAFPAV